MPRKLRIEYLPIAESDLFEIFDYIFLDSPQSAVKMIDLFDERISILAEFPFSGREINDKLLRKLGYRFLAIENYLVFYVIKEKSVEIRRILHGSREFLFLL